MNGWEQEQYIYHLDSAPKRETDLENYINKYLDEKDDKYLTWFLHYYEPVINEKAKRIVQNYSMNGHFLDIKQTFVIGMMRALETYHESKDIPFIIYKEHYAMEEVHNYIRTMRTGYTVSTQAEDIRLRKTMRLFNKYGKRSDAESINKIAKEIETSPELVYEIIYSALRNQKQTDFYQNYSDDEIEDNREEIMFSPTTEPESIFFKNLQSNKLWKAFESLDYRERAMVSAHLGFCMECYSTFYYDNDDIDEKGKPKKKEYPKQTFQQLAIDHELSSANTALIIYKRAINKLRKAINEG